MGISFYTEKGHKKCTLLDSLVFFSRKMHDADHVSQTFFFDFVSFFAPLSVQCHLKATTINREKEKTLEIIFLKLICLSEERKVEIKTC